MANRLDPSWPGAPADTRHPMSQPWTEWFKMDHPDTPKDGTPILCHDDEGTIFITSWTDDAWAEQGGRGGPAGWFSSKYRDRWGDYPIFDEPVRWSRLPQPDPTALKEGASNG